MYNEQFFQLFEKMASDGELTPQELAVLERSAEAMGIDGEKFGIYFEARIVERYERLQHQPGGEAEALAIMQRYEKVMAALSVSAPPPAPAAEKEPHKEATPEQHEEIGKCPACKETINGLNHVCPSCGLVIDADHDTHGSLEEMLEDQEQILLKAKAFARSRAAESDLGLSYLTVPFIMICIGALMIRYGSSGWGVFGMLLWLGAFILYRVLRKAYKTSLLPAPGQSLPELQERFEKNDRQITLFFGDDSKVGQVLHTLRQQMAVATAPFRAKNSMGRLLVRLVLFAPVVFAISGPKDTSPTPDEPTAADFPDERPKQIQRLLNEQNIPEARALLAQLPDSSAARPALLEALYESSQNHRLDSLRSLLPQRQYDVVRRGLISLWWNPAATTDTAARPAFEARKRRLNDELPAKYRLDEGWLTATGTHD